MLTASACQWWLWLSKGLGTRPAPAIEQAKLGTVYLEWVSLPPASSKPLRTMPQEDSCQNIKLITSLPALSACCYETLNLDWRSGPSIPAPPSPRTPTEPRPFPHWISLVRVGFQDLLAFTRAVLPGGMCSCPVLLAPSPPPRLRSDVSLFCARTGPRL